MGHKYTEIMFTDAVKELQIEKRSRAGYERMEHGEDFNHLLSEVEADFIAQRDSFYMASVGETGWPYVQHRGGPTGFVKVLDAQTIGFADFSGNRQYISTGNLKQNNRVSLFFMDYPNQRRLKMIGRVEIISDEHHDAMQSLKSSNYRAKVERGYIIHVEAFDWNCPQHITPRYTQSEVEEFINQRVSAALATRTIENQQKAVLGEGPLSLVITGIRQLTPNVRQYEFSSLDGEPLPKVTPGSHIAVPVLLSDGSTVLRHYSLCSSPAQRSVYQIAVLKEENGTGGSASIHKTYQLGMQLNYNPPVNYFDFETDHKDPIILIAGGIGITPILSMAYHFTKTGHNPTLHYAGKKLSDMPFAETLLELMENRVQFYAKDKNERLNVYDTLLSAPQDAKFYVCGPNRLIDDVLESAAKIGIPATSIAFERFKVVRDERDQTIQVTLLDSNSKIDVPPATTILDALLAAGIDAPYSCKTGQCKQCMVEVIDGEPEHRDKVLTETEKQTFFCPCVSRAKSATLTLKL